MRMVFGVLGLLVVLAVAGWAAKQQLQAARVSVVRDVGASSPSASAAPTSQSQALQRKVADEVNQLMQQAPARIEGASQ